MVGREVGISGSTSTCGCCCGMCCCCCSVSDMRGRCGRGVGVDDVEGAVMGVGVTGDAAEVVVKRVSKSRPVRRSRTLWCGGFVS